MNTKYSSLIQFETDRKKEGYIPPEGSNSFYTINDGTLNLYTKRSNPDDYRFDVTIDGHVYVGAGLFELAGEVVDTNRPYGDMSILNTGTLSVNRALSANGGIIVVGGELDMMDNAHLLISNGSHVTLNLASRFRLGKNVTIKVEDGCSLNISGEIILSMDDVDRLFDTPNVHIDSAAILTVSGLDALGERIYSLTDYEVYMRDKVVGVLNQGEFNFPEGRLGYTWVAGDPVDNSKVLMMRLLYGISVLGDFKLSVLGVPETIPSNSQFISILEIGEGTTLAITERYQDSIYMHPQLYIGPIIDNCKVPGECIINGDVLVDGDNASITLDRGGKLTLHGTLTLTNGAKMMCTNNGDDLVLFIDGTLIIDTIDQISSFNHDNIRLQGNAKIIIKNPDTGEKKLLFTTPNGLKDTELYRLFGDRLDKVEYHVSNNNGIGIDRFYEYYSTYMTEWYAGMRIEKAIHDGLIVWHDGGFIELNHDVIPWVNIQCTLLDAASLFKSYGSTDAEKLQDVVNRLRYAGCGNIVFRFVQGDHVSEVLLNLKGAETVSIINYPTTDQYHAVTTGDCELYLKSNIGSIDMNKIISKTSKIINVDDTEVDFILK